MPACLSANPRSYRGGESGVPRVWRLRATSPTARCSFQKINPSGWSARSARSSATPPSSDQGIRGHTRVFPTMQTRRPVGWLIASVVNPCRARLAMTWFVGSRTETALGIS
jgi:hypothetical protein